MKRNNTTLKDAYVFEPKIFGDDRGYFTEIFKQADLGFDVSFVQDNQSLSATPGTVRGMHLQKGEYSQAKLVRVVTGKIIDVIVDLRPDSETFLKHESFELDAVGMKSLFVPRGFGHGFMTLEPNTVVTYKVDNKYNQQSEVSIKWDDAELNIEWPKFDKYITSKKDDEGISLKEYLNE